MYSRVRLAGKYLGYYLTAINGRGHGVHSPFVYELVRGVLCDKSGNEAFAAIEGLRRRLFLDEGLLEVEDMGAGAARGGVGVARGGMAVEAAARAEGGVRVEDGVRVEAPVEGGMRGEARVEGGIRVEAPVDDGVRVRKVADIARHAAKPARLGRLLFRLAKYYRPSVVVELGTSLGLSAAYLASGAPDARLWTIEGSAAVAERAKRHLSELGLEGVEVVTGNFDVLLEPLVERVGPVDLAFIDGNHRCEPTLRYFDILMRHSGRSALLIFDDIHWSADMERAWAQIKADPRVMLTIDLFFFGLVVIRDEFKVKQDFMIRF
jgi:predicted O-methyltransferase YrrM